MLLSVSSGDSALGYSAAYEYLVVKSTVFCWLCVLSVKVGVTPALCQHGGGPRGASVSEGGEGGGGGGNLLPRQTFWNCVLWLKESPSGKQSPETIVGLREFGACGESIL